MVTMEALIEGNVGKAELSFDKDGKPRFAFSVAVNNDYWNKVESKSVERPATWYNFTLWDEGQIKRWGWLTKGMHVLVRFSGLETKEFDGKDGKQISLNPKFVTDVWEYNYHKKVDLDGNTSTDSDDITLA